ncbi:uncharacterized protein ACOB8E_009459 isoform 3-T3 [Sarcophilus harrisii]
MFLESSDRSVCCCFCQNIGGHDLPDFSRSRMFLVEIHSSAVGSASGMTRVYPRPQALTQPGPFQMPSKPFHITVERRLLSLLASLLVRHAFCMCQKHIVGVRSKECEN